MQHRSVRHICLATLLVLSGACGSVKRAVDAGDDPLDSSITVADAAWPDAAFPDASIADAALPDACTPATGATTFAFTGSVQAFIVPTCVNAVTIDVSGAQGGGLNGGGGLGARIRGDFVVTPGETLLVVVGEMGQLQVGGPDENSSGGGGGSFVYTTSTLLIAAGGGGGKCNFTGSVPLHADAHGTATENAGSSSDGTLGGTSGNGGSQGTFGGGIVCAGGGTGWLTPGGSDAYGGKNTAAGWVGGDGSCESGTGCGGRGGFGGGGGGGVLYGGGGGGGGYSGGGGGTDPHHGGGGGSFNAGANQLNQGGVRVGNGEVTITW